MRVSAMERKGDRVKQEGAHLPTSCFSIACRAGNAVPYTLACIAAVDCTGPPCGVGMRTGEACAV